VEVLVIQILDQKHLPFGNYNALKYPHFLYLTVRTEPRGKTNNCKWYLL